MGLESREFKGISVSGTATRQGWQAMRAAPPRKAGIRQYLQGTDDGLHVNDRIESLALPVVVGVDCLKFDSVGDGLKLDTPITIGDGFTFTGYFASDDRSKGLLFFGSFGATTISYTMNAMVRALSDQFFVRARTAGGTDYTQQALVIDVPNINILFDGNFHKLSIDYTSSTGMLVFYIDDIICCQGSTWSNGLPDVTNLIESVCDGYIGGVAPYFHYGSAKDISITQNNIDLLNLPMEESEGLTVYDTSGNGNNGTIITTDDASLALMRAGKSDDTPSVNLLNGFTRNSIVGGGHGYLDIGVIPNQNTEVEITFIVRNMTVNHGIFGARDGATLNSFNLFLLSYNGRLRADYANSTYPMGTPLIEGERVHLRMNNDGAFINGIREATFIPGTVSQYPIKILTVNTGGANTAPSTLEIQHFKLTQDDIVVRDMFPISGGRMYDKINNVTYINEGTGTLTTSGYVPALPFKSKSVATFDGAGAQISSDAVLNYGADDFEIEIVMKCPTFAQNNPSMIFAAGDGNDHGIRLAVCTNLTAYLASINTVDVVFNVARDDEVHIFRLSRVGDIFTVYVDGNYIDSKDVSGQSVDITGKSYLMAVWGGANSGHAGGEMYSAKASGYFDYDFTQYQGRSTARIEDISGNGNHGTVEVGAGGLDSFWTKRVADEAGEIVDANYYPVTNPGGYIMNGADVSIKHADPGIVGTIVVSGMDDPDANGTYIWVPVEECWFNASYVLRVVGGNAAVEAEFGDLLASSTGGGLDIPADDGTWSGDIPTFSWDSWWADSATGKFTERTYAEWRARQNITQDQLDRWKDVSGVLLLERSVSYAAGTIDSFTPAEETRAQRFSGD